ncbi:MAG: VCBS repeat-containing protein [Planctomycetes bacterium]|nr:VCBS repeat-containing protein [Planctomycetota bacterium]
MTLHATIALTGALLLPAATAQQFVVAPERRVPASIEGGRVATADIDGDGDSDFCVVRQGQDRLYRNDGHGAFDDVTAIALPPDPASWSLGATFGDIDGDGDQDLLIGRFGLTGVYLNDGQGRFADSGRWFGDVLVSRIVLADVDSDGDLDAIAGNPQRPVQILLNDGVGSFTDGTAGRLPSFRSTVLCAVDVDGDADPDLLFQRIDRGEPNLFLNDGSGRFVGAPGLLRWVGPPTDIEAGDLDGDGDVDLVFTGVNETGVPTDLLFLQEGGTFAERTATHMPQHGHQTRDIALVDVDEDGDLDLWLGVADLIVSPAQNRLYLNDGSAHLRDATTERLPPLLDLAVAVAAADFDDDGDIDLLTSETTGGIPGRTRVLLNGHRQLDALAAPVRGLRYEYLFRSRPGYARFFAIAVGAVALGRTRMELAPFGTWYLDPASMVELPPVYVPPAAGEATWSFPIPDDPAVVGRELGCQAAFLDPLAPARLSSALFERVGG